MDVHVNGCKGEVEEDMQSVSLELVLSSSCLPLNIGDLGSQVTLAARNGHDAAAATYNCNHGRDDCQRDEVWQRQYDISALNPDI